MASKLNQPTGFKKLTNVAFIKYKVGGQKFEIVCYKNKAINWRNGVEKDLSEVLQSEEVFENATHGTLAKKDQLAKVFPKMSKEDIIKVILEKGELQISDKEREVQLSNTQKDIINFVQEKVVHPESQRQFSIEQLSQAIQDIHFNVKPDQPAKKQALQCIQELQQKYYIMRANMKVSLIFKEKYQEKLDNLLKNIDITQTQKGQPQQDEQKKELICVIQPSKYRPLIDGLKQDKIPATCEVLVNNVINKNVQDISNTENVELRIRDDWKEEDPKKKQEQEELERKKLEEAEAAKKKNKKQRKKQHNRELKEQQEREEEEKQKKLNQLFMQQKQRDPNDIQSLLEEKKLMQKKQQEEEQKLQQQDENQNKNKDNQNGKKCTHCKDAVFSDPKEFRNHYKSDWHVENVKRKTKEQPALSYQEFQIIQLDAEFMK
ncbi:Ribosome maturation protein SBDS, N-terminal [Pseudocohnilembus persalinus]|uniref:Ribosome maturation protein SBDS, N-terminal n=1 Tax=Pseudocohnilembus persalinus TaxID=266149 RepID=A0A0V0QVX5_PSEPJ|nr:Ribosome maturation protein SBDS, N-terminal [Pseudocohnilembus persalinus]|eukprot:KRX06366.1 Ribosome maturation protein SBDS, N-terminal [Pseudocohnilembus persalinus]